MRAILLGMILILANYDIVKLELYFVQNTSFDDKKKLGIWFSVFESKSLYYTDASLSKINKTFLSKQQTNN